MVQFLLLCLILIGEFSLRVVANDATHTHTTIQPEMKSVANSPAEGPSGGEIPYNAEAPVSRKLGKHQQQMVNSIGSIGLSPSPPLEVPSQHEIPHGAEAPAASRKLGKYQQRMVNSIGSPGLSPSAPHSPQEKKHSNKESKSSSESKLVGASEEAKGMSQKLHHQHSADKSIAGGGVILGGLAAIFLVSVFCYIKATRRHKPET